MKKSRTSPTQRSLKWLRENGFTCAVTEQNVRIPDQAIPGGFRIFKRDLFGFCDILAVKPEVIGTTFVQVTSGMGSHKTSREQKIEEAPASKLALKAGNTIELHIWRKLGPRGGVKRWELYRAKARLHGDKLSWLDMSEKDDDFAVQPGLIFEKA